MIDPRQLTPESKRLVRQAARRRAAVTALAGFCRHMWEIVEPARKLEWAWYLDLICRELEAVMRGEVKELAICLPPGHAKSRIVNVLFPAYLWLHEPSLKVMNVSNSPSVATRDSRYTRLILESREYQVLQLARAHLRKEVKLTKIGRAHGNSSWRPWGFAKDQNEKTCYANTASGERFAQSINTKVLGNRCNGLIFDDPIDSQTIMLGNTTQIGTLCRDTQTQYHGVYSSRLNRPNAWRITVSQRLHPDDVPGDVIERALAEPGAESLHEGQIRAIVIPLHYDSEHPHLHPDDPRSDGEILAPSIFSEQDAIEQRKGMGGRHFDTQYEQRTSQAAGGLYKREWFEHCYEMPPYEVMQRGRLDELAFSVDCTFKTKKTSDYVTIGAWGLKRKETKVGVPPGRYLLDVVRARMDLLGTIAAIKRLGAKWPTVGRILVEDKANGTEVINMMQKQGHHGVVPFEPGKASKEARAEMATLSFESRQVWLPREEYAPWLHDYVEEMCSFPGGAFDDQVDMTSQMMIVWDRRASGSVEAGNRSLAWVDLMG